MEYPKTREGIYDLINALYERAEKLPLDVTHGATYCRECGSTDVDYEGWQRPNENDRANGGMDQAPSYCNACEEDNEPAFFSPDPPLFCKCLTESGQPLAAWDDERLYSNATCAGCGEPYTATRPEPEEKE